MNVDAEIDASARKMHRLGILRGPTQESGYSIKGEEIVRTMLHEIEAADLPRQMRGDDAENLKVLHDWLTVEGFDKGSSLTVFDWTVLLATALPAFLRMKQRLDFADRVSRRR